MSTTSRGAVLAVLAFGSWGLFPLYFHVLHSIPALDVLAHRILWSFVSVTIFLILKQKPRAALQLWKNPERRKWLIISTLLVSSNWFIFIYGVQIGRVLESSLGYFLTPLFNIATGIFFLGESLRRLQKIAVALAAGGILWLLLQKGAHVPWISLGLMTTFGLYGFLKKKSQVESLSALAFESTLLIGPTLIYLFCIGQNMASLQVKLGAEGLVLLFLSGIITLLPLWAFAEAARSLPMVGLGFFQYLTPLLQLLCGLYLGESFKPGQREAFVATWAALLLVSIDGWKHHGRAKSLLAKSTMSRE
jgi:chloramphenicol-sensitive protein RarD